nr:uncharacterized protein LOC127329312 [Lolium perenne]
MPPMHRFQPNLGFRPETAPNPRGSREVSAYLSGASKEGNDAHGSRRRRHRPSGIDFRPMPYPAHAARRIGAADLVIHTAATTALCRCSLTKVLHQLPASPRRTHSELHLQPRHAQQQAPPTLRLQQKSPALRPTTTRPETQIGPKKDPDPGPGPPDPPPHRRHRGNEDAHPPPWPPAGLRCPRTPLDALHAAAVTAPVQHRGSTARRRRRVHRRDAPRLPAVAREASRRRPLSPTAPPMASRLRTSGARSARPPSPAVFDGHAWPPPPAPGGGSGCGRRSGGWF